MSQSHDPSPADVTAIVVAHDSAAPLRACVPALLAGGARVLVVDNASRDGSAEVASRLGADVLRRDRNEGYGRANNAGVAAAETSFILVCNPDAIVDPPAPAWTPERTPNIADWGLWAPRIVEPDGRLFFQPRSLLASYLTNPGGRLWPPEGDCCAPFLSGACFLMRRDLFLGLGGFDSRIFLFYEDDDLCRRLTEAGLALIHVHAAVVRHGRGRSSAPGPGRVFRSRWHQAWSRAYVSKKWGLADPAPGMAALNGVKAILALATGRRSLFERYGGSSAGALAFLRGRTALRREGLAELEPVVRREGPAEP